MSKSNVSLFILMFLCLSMLIGCTTASYGLKPTPVTEQKDTFTFKIFTGGFAGGEASDKRASEEFDLYKNENDYKSYKILNKQYELVPSGFVYTVRFFRDSH
ncbi:MAG: hypothetical protein RPU15_02910 [Candidatus Sedimenticola sp. (ex Thyasira tokunagai)]